MKKFVFGQRTHFNLIDRSYPLLKQIGILSGFSINKSGEQLNPLFHLKKLEHKGFSLYELMKTMKLFVVLM